MRYGSLKSSDPDFRSEGHQHTKPNWWPCLPLFLIDQKRRQKRKDIFPRWETRAIVTLPAACEQVIFLKISTFDRSQTRIVRPVPSLNSGPHGIFAQESKAVWFSHIVNFSPYIFPISFHASFTLLSHPSRLADNILQKIFIISHLYILESNTNTLYRNPSSAFTCKIKTYLQKVYFFFGPHASRLQSC